jgi:hypothetical protein
MPLIRDAGPGDIRAVLGVYSARITADAGYLPFLEAGDEPTVLAGSCSSRSWPAWSPSRTAWSPASPDCGTPNRALEPGHPADAGWKRAAWPSTPRTAAARSRWT